MTCTMYNGKNESNIEIINTTKVNATVKCAKHMGDVWTFKKF